MSLTLSGQISLIDHILPVPATSTRKLLIDILLVAAFSLFIALTAQISFYLPFTKVPVTLQTLGVLLTGATLGSKRGGLALLAYLAEGATGLPFFAGGAGGIIKLFGFTAGYLWAFPVAAYVTGWLCEKKLDRSFATSAIAMLPGALIIYALGVFWLAFTLHLSLSVAIAQGMLPFIPGDAFKLVIAALLLPAAWNTLKRIK